MPGFRSCLAAAAIAVALPALTASAAEDAPWVAYTTGTAFDDVAFEVTTLIEGRGYVIDAVSHVGDMLNRTAGDVGATTALYEKADVYQFCSATLSRKVMEADPMNIAYCPYGIFVVQMAGSDEVMVGYRRFPDGPMAEVEAMLDEIAKGAAGVD